MIKETLIDSDHVGHEAGICIYNKKTGLALLRIPKNGSSTLHYHTVHTDPDTWEQISFLKENITPKKICIVLRDPVERFISAMNYMLKLEGFPTHKSNFITFQPIDKWQSTFFAITNDAHFKPQLAYFYWLEELKIPTEFFYLKPGLINDLNNHYDEINWPSDPHNTRGWARIVKADNEQIIKSAFKADYDLINSVKFVNHVFTEPLN